MKEFDKTRIKAVVLDLDGTIVDAGVLCPGVADVLEKISSLGTEVVVATGRPLRDFPEGVKAMQFVKYAITLNGACVFDYAEKRYLHRMPMDGRLVEDITAFLSGKPAYVHLMSDDALIATPECVKKTWERFAIDFPEVRIDGIKDLLTAADSPASYARENSIPIYKLHAKFDDSEQCEEALAELNDRFDVEAAFVIPMDIEITSKGVNKGVGVEKLAEHLGFAMDEIVAIGDSGNDAEMLKSVGLPIAMENGQEELKGLAAIVAPPINQNGVVKVLERLFGI